MSTIITNVVVVTMNTQREVIKHGFAAWEDGKITAVGTMDTLETVIAEARKHETGDGLRLFADLVERSGRYREKR